MDDTHSGVQRSDSADDRPDLARRRLLLPLSARPGTIAAPMPAAAEPESRCPVPAPGSSSATLAATLPAAVAAAPDEPDGAIAAAPLFMTLAQAIRRRSAEGNLSTSQDFSTPPYSLDEQQFQALAQQISADADCADICGLAAGTTHFYYSDRSMTHNYANILALLSENNIGKTIADTVRFECRVYPRPYKLTMLELAPFLFQPAEIGGAMAVLSQSEDYQDIHSVAASNGEIYLYSDRFMSYGKAKGLCEWIEVEQYENP